MFSLFRSLFSRADRVQEDKKKDSERRDGEEETNDNILSPPPVVHNTRSRARQGKEMGGPAGVSAITGAQLRDSKKRSGPALLTDRDSESLEVIGERNSESDGDVNMELQNEALVPSLFLSSHYFYFCA